MITPAQVADAIRHANKCAGSQPSPIWIDMMLGRLMTEDVLKSLLEQDEPDV